MTKYFVATVSKSHVMIGTELGIAQAGHGKRQPLARMKKGDWLIYYSPKESYEGNIPLQAFTAIGEMADDQIYQESMSEGFKPFRRKVYYVKSQDAPIKPLIEKLEFIKNKTSWGYAFRFGIFEISKADFECIAAAMHANITEIKEV